MHPKTAALRAAPSSSPALSAGDALRRKEILFRGFALILFFWALAADYLFVYFSSDDLMNLYQAVDDGSHLWRGLALFWSSHFSRPVGQLLYLGIYSLFGLHPLPFKLVMLLLLTANILIGWRVASLILEDSGLGALAALLIAFHPWEKGEIWSNLGNFAAIYDITCFLLMGSAFWLWLRARRAGRFPGVGTLVLIVFLQILALDAKEIAVAFPVLVFVRELLWGDLVSWRRRRIEWRTVPAIVVFTLITLVFLIGKRLGADSLWNQPLYQPAFTLHFYLRNMSRFLNQVFYAGSFFRSGLTAWFLCGGLVVAALLRARALAFGWLWFLVTTLPVAFLPGRSGMVLYGALLGPAIGLADLLRILFRKTLATHTGGPSRFLNPAALPVFLMALAVLAPISWRLKQAGDAAAKQRGRLFREFADDLQRFPPSRPDAPVLLLRDPFTPDRYDPEFLESLITGVHPLKVLRLQKNQALLSPAAFALFNDVYDFDRGRLHPLAPADRTRVISRLRAQNGSVDPLSGLDVAPEIGWWVRKDFSLAVQCPASKHECDLTLNLNTSGAAPARSVSVDLGAAQVREFPFTEGPGVFPVVIPVRTTDAPVAVAFHLNGVPADPSIFVDAIQLR